MKNYVYLRIYNIHMEFASLVEFVCVMLYDGKIRILRCRKIEKEIQREWRKRYEFERRIVSRSGCEPSADR
jgi:hypothetical protein